MAHELLKNKDDIVDWLNTYAINNYELIEDEEYGFVVNVNKEVSLMERNLKCISVKFNVIEGNFSCLNNKLVSLYGCPEKVNGAFNVSKNQIETLEYFPKEVKGSIAFSYNKVASLKGLPRVVNGNLFFAHNMLTSLQHCSDFVLWSFLCSNNKLKSLHYGPSIVKKIYLAGENQLETIEYLAQETQALVLMKNSLLGAMQDIRDLDTLKAISQKKKLNECIEHSSKKTTIIKI